VTVHLEDEPAGLATATLERWLREHRPELVATGPLEAQLLQGGRSNLTYRLTSGDTTFVLRRPPLGHVQATAHDMAREFRIISALAGSAVPVPSAILLHDDTDGAAGVGAPFYLMDFVAGRVIASPRDNVGFTAEQLRALSMSLAETLAALHDLDPQSVGLDGFGRPEGYLERQLRRWATQYEGSKSRELPTLDRLQRALHANVPETAYTSLIHGDFRLDNAIVQIGADGDPAIAAVLDWEMATIGDSFADLGLLGLYWDIRSVSGVAGAAVPSSVDPEAGYPSFDEVVDAYAAERGITVPDLSWYVAFSAYKLAVILEGIHVRFTQGKTVGPGFDQIGALVTPLAETGLRSLGKVR
jgi:aminoglycoside phosphotransferase (APT) family kinase protein